MSDRTGAPGPAGGPPATSTAAHHADVVTDDLDPAAEELTLAATFDTGDLAAWRRLVAKVLRSPEGTERPEDALASTTADGIRIAPLYTAADALADPGLPGATPFVRGSRAAGHRTGWDIRTLHSTPDPTACREEVMADLAGGASSLWLQVGPGAIGVQDLPDVLAEVYLDLAPVVLDAGESLDPDLGPLAAAALLDLTIARDVPAAELSAVLGLDPLGMSARTGGTAELARAVEVAARCSREHPKVRAIVVDALAFHDAGATDAQELGCALAAGVEYLRALTGAGLGVEAALGQLEFRYGLTADQFTGIAKLRAARRTWARVAEASGAPTAGGQRQHAVASWPMMTARDPWNNILRNAIAGFAAGVGGADAVTLRPYDSAVGRSDELARRIARNTHALLIDEAHVVRVIDPAGGSWYVEALTEQLAAAAWAWFQEIEAAGGLAAALAGGLVAERIAASAEARRSSLAAGDAGIIGVTDFPLAGEKALDRPALPTPPARGGLPRIRWSQPAELELAAAEENGDRQ